jgi:hypothetical protein
MATSQILLDKKNITKDIFLISPGVSSITRSKPLVYIEETLPFRVKFTAIKVPGYSQTNPPPIPLQVIGFSNYIL